MIFFLSHFINIWESSFLKTHNYPKHWLLSSYLRCTLAPFSCLPIVITKSSKDWEGEKIEETIPPARATKSRNRRDRGGDQQQLGAVF
jgi:hypothetical protein